MTEADLTEAQALVMRFYKLPRSPYTTLWRIQSKLQRMGVVLDRPVEYDANRS